MSKDNLTTAAPVAPILTSAGDPDEEEELIIMIPYKDVAERQITMDI